MDGSLQSVESAQPLEKVGSIFALGRKIGSGSFGKVFYAVNSQNGQEVAVKLEDQSGLHQMLPYEAKLLKHLEGGDGIANVYYSGKEGSYNVMVMDLLGPSLEDLFNSCRRTFSVKSVMMLANQMISRIQYLHAKDFVHRDLKPDNFLVGAGRNCNTVHIIDFGLAKRYRNSKRQHIPFSQRKSLTGTARYASVNAHKGAEQSRRDDMEALGYILLYFSRGMLPWQGLQAQTKEQKYQKILEKKQGVNVQQLCEDCPPVLATYVSYCKSLGFEDEPDYTYLKKLFTDYLSKQGLEDDGQFEWSSRVRAGSGDESKSKEQDGRKRSRRHLSSSTGVVATETGRTSLRTASRVTSRNALGDGMLHEVSDVRLPNVATKSEKRGLPLSQEDNAQKVRLEQMQIWFHPSVMVRAKRASPLLTGAHARSSRFGHSRGLMLSRSTVPLHDDVSSLAELAAIRVSTGAWQPWQDDLHMPRIARPQSQQPPQPPPRQIQKNQSRHKASEDLAERSWLGSADVRIWVMEEKRNTEVADKDLPEAEYGSFRGRARAQSVDSAFSMGQVRRGIHADTLGVEMEAEKVKAFLCHKYILAGASQLLCYRLRCAEQAEGVHASLLRAASKSLRNAGRATPSPPSSPSRHGKRPRRQQLRQTRSSLLEFELRVQEQPNAFGGLMTMLYGVPLKVTLADLKKLCGRGWWPLMSLAKELRVKSVEASLRTPAIRVYPYFVPVDGCIDSDQRSLLMDLCRNAPVDMLWGLLQLTHAHNCQTEMKWCCEVLARNGGKVSGNAGLAAVRSLNLEALGVLLSSDGWVVSMESELFLIVEAWLKGQAWVDWSKKGPQPEKPQPHVYAASAKWGIRWGHIHTELMDRLAFNRIIPASLLSDADRWRASAGVVLPPLASRDTSNVETGQSRREDALPDAFPPKDAKAPKERKQTPEKPSPSPRRPDRRSTQKLAPRKSSVSEDPPQSHQGHQGHQSAESRALSDAIRVILSDLRQIRVLMLSTSAICDAVDVRFGLEYTHYRRLEEKSEHKEEQEISEELKAAKKLAGKRLAYVTPSCPWMTRRRCFHTSFATSWHAFQSFATVAVEKGATTMHYRQALQHSEAVSKGQKERRLSATCEILNLQGDFSRMVSATSTVSAGEESAFSSNMNDLDEDVTRGALVHLIATRAVTMGRHEFLFRVLVERPRFLDREADSLDTKDIIEKFSAAVKLGVGIFANPTFSSVRPTGEESLFDKQFVIPLASGKTAPHSTPSGVVSDIVWLRQDQMLTSVSQSEIPEHWPPAGLLDVFILAVLEPAQKTLSVAVDAGFTKPFGCEDMEPELEEEPEKSQSPWDVTGTGAPKIFPMIATHFVQRRQFLRRWRFEEALKQDLKSGIALSHSMRSAGPNPLLVPVLELDVQALSCMGGDGGSATIEALPGGALRPSWWIDRMGNSVDMPRPHLSAEMEEEPSESLRG
ncbi:CKL2 [Symbiodinium microadriaticum]|nr:CKL2 [Symbiodinium microadriaticum]